MGHLRRANRDQMLTLLSALKTIILNLNEKAKKTNKKKTITTKTSTTITTTLPYTKWFRTIDMDRKAHSICKDVTFYENSNRIHIVYEYIILSFHQNTKSAYFSCGVHSKQALEPACYI